MTDVEYENLMHNYYVKAIEDRVQKKTIEQCRDMFIMHSKSWNLLDDKLNSLPTYEYGN